MTNASNNRLAMVTLVQTQALLDIPSTLSEIALDELTADQSYATRYIKGRVHFAFPLKPFKNTHIKRLYITSENDHVKAMSVTLLGVYAEEFERHEIYAEDVIYASGFFVESFSGPTSQPSVHSVRILIGTDEDDSQFTDLPRMWAVKKLQSTSNQISREAQLGKSKSSASLQTASVPTPQRLASSANQPSFARSSATYASSSTAESYKQSMRGEQTSTTTAVATSSAAASAATSSAATSAAATSAAAFAKASAAVASSISEPRETASTTRKRPQRNQQQHFSASSRSTTSNGARDPVFGDVHAGPAQKKTRSVVYDYVKLNEVTSGQVVNVFGVVKYLKPPFATRGREMCVVVSLTDPSFTDANQKLKCNIFGNGSQLPPIRAIGDIVRLHRLKIGSFQGELQGQRGPGFSCLVWDGSVGASMKPLSTTTTFTIAEEDLETVKELRLWYNQDNNACLSQRPERSVVDMTLSLAVMGEYFDVICQVVAKRVLTPKLMLLRVWDGTKISYNTRREDFTENTNRNKQLELTAKEFCVDVYIYDDHFPAADAAKPGDFVKFVNLHAANYKNPDSGDDFPVLPAIELILHGGNKFDRCIKVIAADSSEAAVVRERLDKIRPKQTTPIDNDESTQNSEILSLRQLHSSGCYQAMTDFEPSPAMSVDPSMLANMPDNSLFYNSSSSPSCAQEPRPTPESDNDIDALLDDGSGERNNNTVNLSVPQPILEEYELSWECSAGGPESDAEDAAANSDSNGLDDLLKAVNNANQNDDTATLGLSSTSRAASNASVAGLDVSPELITSQGTSQTRPYIVAETFNEVSSELVDSQASVAGSLNTGFANTRSQDSYFTCVSSSPLRLPSNRSPAAEAAPRIELPASTFTSDMSRLQRPSLHACDHSVEVSAVKSKRGVVIIKTEKDDNDYKRSKSGGEPREESRANVVSEQALRGAANAVNDVSLARTNAPIRAGNNCMRITATVTSGQDRVPLTSIDRLLEKDVPYYFRICTFLLSCQPNCKTSRKFIKLLCPECQFVSGVPGDLSDAEPTQSSQPSYSGDSQMFSLDPDDNVRPLSWYQRAKSLVVNGVTMYKCHICTARGGPKGFKVPFLQYVYMLTFLLADDSNCLCAQLTGTEAETFFGVPAIEVIRDDVKYHQVVDRITALCPSALPGDASTANITDRPLLELCISSHFANSCVFYKIVDTTLAAVE